MEKVSVLENWFFEYFDYEVIGCGKRLCDECFVLFFWIEYVI